MSENKSAGWAVLVVRFKSFDISDFDDVEYPDSVFDRETFGSPEEAVENYRKGVRKSFDERVPLGKSQQGGIWTIKVEELDDECQAVNIEPYKIAVFAARYNKETKGYDIDYVQPDEIQKVLAEETEAAKERAVLNPVQSYRNYDENDLDEEMEMEP